MASIQQRPNGSWRARYRDAGGREHARHFKLKRDAQRWLDEVTAAIVTGNYADPRAGKVTWTTWTTAWLDRQTWVEDTVKGARSVVRSVPWRDEPMAAVRPSHVQAWVSGESRRGIAASTIENRLKTVKKAFKAAVTDLVIPSNPADSIRAPRARRKEAAMKLLSVDEIRSALNHAHHFRGFVAVCVFAGLRLGEAAGLQLRDINFLKRTITVERQVQGQSYGVARVVPPKYGSERVIPVADDLLQLLSAHIAAERIAAPDAYLFLTPRGELYGRTSAGKTWVGIRESAELPAYTIHSLRHTFASALIADGCDVIKVQKALGHAKPSITLDTYGHLWPTAEDHTRSALAGFMSDVLGSADSARTDRTKAQVRRP